MNVLSKLELRAGAGGQSFGYEQAGFHRSARVEINEHTRATLGLIRLSRGVTEGDPVEFKGREFQGVKVISGGRPCLPFSVVAEHLGENDERKLFPEMSWLVDQIRPRAAIATRVYRWLVTDERSPQSKEKESNGIV